MSRYFTSPTPEELAALPEVIASLEYTDPRLKPLYNAGGRGLLILIRLLCWKTVPGLWLCEGYGNKLVQGKYELDAFASGYPYPMNLGVSVQRTGWKNGDTPVFQEVVQREDNLSDAELHAWFIAALKRASKVLNDLEKKK